MDAIHLSKCKRFFGVVEGGRVILEVPIDCPFVSRLDTRAQVKRDAISKCVKLYQALKGMTPRDAINPPTAQQLRTAQVITAQYPGVQ